MLVSLVLSFFLSIKDSFERGDRQLSVLLEVGHKKGIDKVKNRLCLLVTETSINIYGANHPFLNYFVVATS